MKDNIQTLRDEAKADYKQRLLYINEHRSVYRKGHVFAEKARQFFVHCTVFGWYGGYKPVIKLYLTKEYNILKDVNLFFEKEESFIDFLLGSTEMKSTHYRNTSLDFDINDVSFEVHYDGGRCLRKQVGTKIVETPVYEIECN